MLFLIPILILMFWMGIFPNTFLRKMDTTINHLLNQIKSKREIVQMQHRGEKFTVLSLDELENNKVNVDVELEEDPR